jgi:endonuclease YncB( thermonuclease family)
MQTPGLIAALAGLPVLVGLILAGGRIVAVEHAAIETPAAMSNGSDPAPAAIAPAPSRDAGRARAVAPQIAAPSFADGTALERAEPRAPMSTLSLAMPRPKGIAEPRLLHRPVAPAAGRIEAQGHVVNIAGVEPVEADRTCRDADGVEWACGVIARTAFRNWLRGRAVECTVKELPEDGAVTSACRLGTQDVGRWLVGNGFAEASSDGPYGELDAEARRQGRGIHAAAPKP